MHHPQVVQSPILNDCLKVNIDGHTRPQIVSKNLLQVSVREVHKSLVSYPYYGGLKEAIDANNNIIISYSTLCSLFPPQLKTVSAGYKVICGCGCCISAKSINFSLLSWRDRYFKNSNIKAKMIKTEVLVKNQIVYIKHKKIQ